MNRQFTGFFIFISIVLSSQIIGQTNPRYYSEYFKQADPLTETDLKALSSIPVLKLPFNFTKPTLPDNLDNSDQPYFRDLFEQVASECGQFTSIAFNFTYEIDYRRNIPANTPENQYPTHFTYNFMNGGYGWHGVSYFHSYEIVKTNGHPNVADYGGVAAGGPSRWLSGYEKYYHGMFNKLENVYQINIGTADGLETLKYWLYNHLEGAAVGGIASFYSPSPWNATTLPAGTPEGGKHVITNFIGTVGHASTITGWNDSIRYDYNNDGQYTNDIDINNDGIVNMKDWETGGLLFMDSYIGGLTWADSAYCYMMYKTLAENTGEGGIWNHAAHIIKVKEDYVPRFAMKVTLNYTSRDKLKVITGVSQNPEDDLPTFRLSFPIFDFQGGNQYMQGGNSNPENKTIEFGLDVTPLLGKISSGKTSKFFLQVIVNDPDNCGSGKIVNFSLMNYINDLIEIPYSQTNIPIIQNGTTTLGIETNIDFDQLIINSNGLPAATVGEPYEFQLDASGGTPPYTWNQVRHYNETSLSGEFPNINEIKMNPSDTIRGMVLQKIDFSFPFYGKQYDSIFVHTEGFIMFDGQNYPWPYLYDENLMIKKTKIVAPYLNPKNVLDTLAGDGIWYEGDENYAAFRWRTTSLTPEMTDINFAVILYPSGEIEYYYDSNEIFVDPYWSGGISNGDGINYKYLHIPGIKNKPEAEVVKFIPEQYPVGMMLTQNGLFTGTPANKYNGVNIEFLVTDYNNISVNKTIPFYSWYAGEEEFLFENGFNLQIYPNPSSDNFKIDFTLQKETYIKINVYNIHGQKVKTIISSGFDTGHHQIIWNGNDNNGARLSEGLYFCNFEYPAFVRSEKLILLSK